MTDWQQGIQALRQGRLREAADRLALAAADHERTVSATARYQTLAHLGAALYALGKASDAVGAFEDACRIAPPPAAPAELQLNLANAYLASGRPDDARRVLGETLTDYPGHLEAQMLLNRLNHRAPDAPLTGAALGETPSGVLRYLRTLTFSTIPKGGYDPAQVRLALGQIERHIEFLVLQLIFRDETIARLQDNLKFAEEELGAQGAADANTEADPQGAPLTPLETLLRQKPRSSSS